MSKPAAPAAPAAQKAKPAAPAAPAKWKPKHRFVDFKRRRITIKVVDEDLGYKAGETVMTATGPVPVSHSHTVTIDRDGYMARSETEEIFLLKLAAAPNTSSPGGSHLVLWENREMPMPQAKAEQDVVKLNRRVEELVEGKASLEAENANQAALIAQLEEQLKAAKGG